MRDLEGRKIEIFVELIALPDGERNLIFRSRDEQAAHWRWYRQHWRQRAAYLNSRRGSPRRQRD